MARQTATQRTATTLRIMHMQHQHTGQLPNATAITTMFLTLVAHNAQPSVWAQFESMATLVLGAEGAQELMCSRLNGKHAGNQLAKAFSAL